MSIICAIYIKEIFYKIFPCGVVVPTHISHCNTAASRDMYDSVGGGLESHDLCAVKMGETVSGEINIYIFRRKIYNKLFWSI